MSHLAALAVLLVLGGSSGGVARAFAQAPTPKAAAREPVRIEFQMPWILPTEYFYFLMADVKGYYREEGIQIRLNEGSGSGNTVKIVGAGSSPIGLADANRILAGRVNGVPIKSIMTLYYTSPVLLISPRDKPLKSLSDLIGKKIGDAPASANLLIWRAAMARKGLDERKVNFVNVDPKAKTQLLLAGQLDAVLGQSDVARLEGQGYPVHYFNVAEDAGFQMVADSVIVSEDFLKRSPDVVRGFLRATIKGAHYAKAHPGEAIDAATKAAPTFSRKQLEILYNMEDGWIWTRYTPKDKFGWQPMEGWTNLQDLLFDNKQIQTKIDLKELVDNSFLPY
jgi:NitT/TauT family transport system substrate-binding protein